MSEYSKRGKNCSSITCQSLQCHWQVANNGGFEALLIDAAGRALNKDYGRRVASHEAGHFLVAYLIGLLPKKYILSSLDAFKRYEISATTPTKAVVDFCHHKSIIRGARNTAAKWRRVVGRRIARLFMKTGRGCCVYKPHACIAKIIHSIYRLSFKER